MKKTIVATLFFAAFSAHATEPPMHVFPHDDSIYPSHSLDGEPYHWYKKFQGLAAGWQFCKRSKCYGEEYGYHQSPYAAAAALMGSRDFNLCNVLQRKCMKDGLAENHNWQFETAPISAIEASMGFGPYDADLRIEIFQRSTVREQWYQPLNGWHVAPYRDIECQVIPDGGSTSIMMNLPANREVTLLLDAVETTTQSMPVYDPDAEAPYVSTHHSSDGDPDGYWDYATSMTDQEYQQCIPAGEGRKECIQHISRGVIDGLSHVGEPFKNKVMWVLVGTNVPEYLTNQTTGTTFGCWFFNHQTTL